MTDESLNKHHGSTEQSKTRFQCSVPLCNTITTVKWLSEELLGFISVFTARFRFRMRFSFTEGDQRNA